MCCITINPCNGENPMEHTQEQLANALKTIGFQRTAYPSDKYQVFDNGT